MKLSKVRAKENLSKLIEKFEKENLAGRINNYNEEATKTGFIQPFLRNVLGWNVSDRDEVSPEERTSRGRVDYGLKIQGQTKLFIEVKPPKADLDKHIKQAVGYGYNRKSVPFVLLTDFEELKLFDVTIKPDIRNSLKGLKLDLDWKEYLLKFDKIWLLSKESVLNGELDKLLLKKPKDRLPVDKAILDDLKEWREKLAKDIFKNNPNLFHSPPPSLPPRKGEEKGGGADYLKEITQRIIDRIMFMRSCEDRNLIHRRSLKDLFEERTETVGTNTMVFLGEEFKHYNIIFDSDLFRPQDWETNLAIDFKVMKDIILDTYNPYQFDVIPLEVLGNMYEQYLGYTIRLTDHQVKYELKPDVRKAGGVYYTPEYIVDYIVKNTVGKLLKELPANRFLSFRTKRGISSKTKKLRILDPACGSGSFLIRAYEEMLNYYRNQKKTKCHAELVSASHKTLKQVQSDRLDKGKGDNSGVQRVLSLPDGDIEPILTIEEKSQILQEHIFGVDIDEQAVEVTKLSLMLKMLEGEFGIIPGRSILPMLDKNIRCGNSLISGDTLELKKYFGDDWYKVKAFNWKDEFRQIMVDEGGFDVVIGNPPYIKIQKLQEFQPKEVNYLKDTYFSSSAHSVDIYVIFIEKALTLLAENGLMGYICPHKFFNSKYGEHIRSIISEHKNIVKVLNFGINQVFEHATTYTCLLFLSGKKQTGFQYYEFKNEVADLEEAVTDGIKYFNINSKKIHSRNWVFVTPEFDAFLIKVRKDKPELGNITTNIFQGPKSGADPVFILRLLQQRNKRCICYSSSIDENIKMERGILKPYVKGRNIRRYYIKRSDEYILYPYDKNGILIPEKTLKISFPLAYEYLSNKTNKRILFDREKGRFRKIWWSYSRPQNMRLLDKKKILTPFNAFAGSFAFDDVGDFIFSAGVSGAYGLLFRNDVKENHRYFLGVLNSTLIDQFLKTISTALRGRFYSYENKYIKQLPIKTIDLSNTNERKLHDNLVALVDVMLDLNKRIQTAKGSRKNQIQRQITKTDKEIDDLVYKLYGITEEERKIIEEKVDSYN